LAAASAQFDFQLVRQGATRRISEFDFVRICCRNPRQDSMLSEALRHPIDWDRVLKLATHHRVLPAVYDSLRGRTDVPASIRAAVDARFLKHTRRVLRFSALLAGILPLFRMRGVEVLPHKGPVLAQQLYGDPAMRDFGDLDFLARATDVPRACTALRELGYQPKLALSPRQEQEYLRTGYEYVFGSVAEPNLIEVQWQIVPRFYSISFVIDSLFQRSVECEFEGMRVRSLCNEDLMLVLCVHAAKHEWSQLGMVRDIAMLARAELNWPWVMGEARRLGIQRIVAVSLDLARTLLGLELPQGLAFHPAVLDAEFLTSAIQEHMSRGEEPAVDSIRYFRSMMTLRERWPDRVQLVWRLASTSSIGDWQAVSLPDQLFPVYRLVRVTRLLKRGLRGPISALRALSGLGNRGQAHSNHLSNV
jgi:hypothetical protein